MKIKLSAVIPTVQYGNIQPEFEAEVDDALSLETFAELEKRIQQVWAKYGEKPLNIAGGTIKRIKAFVGGEIDYDEVNHIYSWNGEKYLSGSEYAKSKQKPFDSVLMSGIAAKKTGSDPLEIAKLWELGGKVSREFGTNVHQALEVYGKYQSLCKTLEKEYHLPNHPVLKSIIESFYAGRESEKAEYEVLVVDHKAKRAGTIDRLQIISPPMVSSDVPMTKNNPSQFKPGVCIIQDYKITHKDELEYWEDQLGFYEGILKAAGWTVLGKEIHKYNGQWTKVEV